MKLDHVKKITALMLTGIAFFCCILIITGILGIINLDTFSIGNEIGIRVLAYVSVGNLLLVAIMYFE